MDESNGFNIYFQSVIHEDSDKTSDIPKIPSSLLINEQGVVKMIKQLKNGKAPGPDSIREVDQHIDIPLTANILTKIVQYFPT